nr:MAG TPA: hypothetical protein [Caudoviricetes sp.]
MCCQYFFNTFRVFLFFIAQFVLVYLYRKEELQCLEKN